MFWNLGVVFMEFANNEVICIVPKVSSSGKSLVFKLDMKRPNDSEKLG